MNAKAPSIALLAVLLVAGCGAAPDQPTAPEPPDADAGAGDEAIRHTEMAVFIMAKCPHCAELLKTLLPLKRELGNALALSIGYVGSVDALGRADLAHGDAEVAAAALQVCVGLNTDDVQWIDFLTCQYEGRAWRKAPKGWTDCAQQVGVDIEAVTTCVDDGDGEEALGRAIEASAASGIDAAPTIAIGRNLYVGGRSREALLQHICYLAGEPETRPPLCGEVEPPARVAGTLLFDHRCEDPDLCDVRRELDFLQIMIPTLELAELEYATSDGQRLYELITTAGGPRFLPLLVLDDGLKQHPDVLERMEEYLVEIGDGFLMPLGQGWDPTAEICGNGKDDDANGQIDCDDARCAATPECRAEVPRRLDLFVMSQCPFAARLIPQVERVLDHFGRDPRKLTLRLQFIGDVTADGELRSMHGQAEVAEDLRMICAQQLYPKKHKFMEYVACRAQDYHSDEWEKCVPKGMSAKKIAQCAEGKQGRELLAASFELADDVGLTGSPSWLLNDRFALEGRTAERIVEGYCHRNELKECVVEVAPAPMTVPGYPSTDTCE